MIQRERPDSDRTAGGPMIAETTMLLNVDRTVLFFPPNALLTSAHRRAHYVGF